MTTFASDGTTQTDPGADLSQEPGETPTDEPTQPEPGATADPGADIIDPEVVDADTLPALRDTTDTTDITDVPVPAPAPAKWVHPDGWAYDWVEFKGDKLAIRIPKGAALVGLEFSRFRGEEAQEQAFGRFIARHVSDETFDRILDRMGDPDDEDYGTTTLGELAGLLGKIAGERLAKDAKALEEAKNGRARKGNS